VVLPQVRHVALDQQVSQPLPWEDVEPVVPVLCDSDEHHNEAAYRAGLGLSHDLAVAVERDLAVAPEIAKLPTPTSCGLDLHGDVSARLVGRADVT